MRTVVVHARRRSRRTPATWILASFLAHDRYTRTQLIALADVLGHGFLSEPRFLDSPPPCMNLCLGDGEPGLCDREGLDRRAELAATIAAHNAADRMNDVDLNELVRDRQRELSSLVPTVGATELCAILSPLTSCRATELAWTNESEMRSERAPEIERLLSVPLIPADALTMAG